jgi:hypothetical protein
MRARCAETFSESSNRVIDDNDDARVSSISDAFCERCLEQKPHERKHRFRSIKDSGGRKQKFPETSNT